MIQNQKKEYIPHLFKFAQIVMATNKNAVKYATCGTGEKFWNVWREQNEAFADKILSHAVVGREITAQDRNIVSLFEPSRLLNLTKYFVIVDESHRSNYGGLAAKNESCISECLLYRIYRNSSYEIRKKYNAKVW